MARLHLDSLRYKTNLGDLRDAVRCFPTGLDELYKDTWTRIDCQDLEWKPLAYRTLGWLSSVFRQMNVEELRHALTVKSGDTVLDTETLPAVDILCESCHALVTVDEESRIVRLVHRTAQEFFDRHRTRYFPGIHTQISRTCLDYLMLDVLSKGPCDFISSRTTDMVAAKGDIFESRLLTTRLTQNPFFDYAATNWGVHARGGPEHEIEGQTLRFLQASSNLDSCFQVQFSGLRCGGIRYASLRDLEISGSLPLHVTVSFRLEHIVDTILKKLSAREVNGLDHKGKTALHWAVLSGSEPLALLLMQAGAKIEKQIKADDAQGSYPGYSRTGEVIFGAVPLALVQPILVHNEEILNNAITFGMRRVIKMYMDCAANAAEKRGRANVILWRASSLGKLEMVDFSLANGADLEAIERDDIQTPHGFEIERYRVHRSRRRAKNQTALLMAVEHGRVEVTRVLLSRGAQVSATDRFGKNVLQPAVASTKVFDERLTLIYTNSSNFWNSTTAGATNYITSSQMSRFEEEYDTKLSHILALGPYPSKNYLD